MSETNIQITEDVPAALAGVLSDELVRYGGDPSRAPHRFRLGLSGGGSGKACAERLAGDQRVDWSRIAVYLADERCVDPTSSDANIAMLRAVLAAHLEEVELHPMDCAAGAPAYEAELVAAGGLDLLQLGFGPDGHIASLFPRSAGLLAAEDRLVIENRDPLDNNPFDRLTLSFAGIAQASHVVITVVGAAKREAFAAIASGEDLPASRVRAPHVLWLVEPIIAADLDLSRFSAPI